MFNSINSTFETYTGLYNANDGWCLWLPRGARIKINKSRALDQTYYTLLHVLLGPFADFYNISSGKYFNISQHGMCTIFKRTQLVQGKYCARKVYTTAVLCASVSRKSNLI